ncbi:NUDIX domain-containing protein [Labrys sp. La1]|uniref:NUDIX domain-containing protein n=1 Tax=Labrys sp. La1 TaxID=3404917 RepID=UPI003EBE25F5
MAKMSAGILLYRLKNLDVEVLLVHPGGPFWAKRDEQAWSIPKGEYGADEDAHGAALREFEEELGTPCPDTGTIDLGEILQPGGKQVSAWAVAGDFDPGQLRSNMFEMEWPPRSRRIVQFPEVDKAQWFVMAQAHRKILPAQRSFLERLAEHLEPDLRFTPA